jgi:hypothetical protein
MSKEGNLKGIEREALVIAELSRKGFETFKALGATSCDLIALKLGVCLRIEVKGIHTRGTWRRGPITSEGRGKGHPDCRKFDVLAQVDDDNKIVHYTRSAICKVSDLVLELTKDNESYDRKVRNDVRERLKFLCPCSSSGRAAAL